MGRPLGLQGRNKHGTQRDRLDHDTWSTAARAGRLEVPQTATREPLLFSMRIKTLATDRSPDMQIALVRQFHEKDIREIFSSPEKIQGRAEGREREALSAGLPGEYFSMSHCELTKGLCPLSLEMRGLHRGPDLGYQ